MSNIHPTAIIEHGADIHDSVHIGPYCVIHAGVKIAAHVTLKSHVVLDGDTEIGEGTTIYPFASIGSPTQDLKFHAGEASKLIIGKKNVIREYVTINPGHTEPEKLTKVGDNCLFMIGSHIAHDCMIGNNVIMANNATLAGHIRVGDNVIIGGLSAVHQFVRIGDYAMIGGMSAVEKDVIPYGLVKGERASLAGLNLIGLKRRGFTREQIQTLRQAYDDIFHLQGNLMEKVANMNTQDEGVRLLIDFIKAESHQGLCQPAA